MKIFAKRKKRSASTPEKRTENKSDPLVEELLKKDPSEWNAKERRMVHRYQKRKAEEGKSAIAVDTADETKDSDAEILDEKEDETKPAGEDAIENDNASSSRDDSSSDSDSDEKEEPAAVQEEFAEKNAMDTTDAAEKKEESAENQDGDDKIDENHEIWSMLHKLNSKQKRTLSRKLDRQGSSVLEEVEKEAKELLGESGDGDQTPKEDDKASTHQKPDLASQPPSAKKRKKDADWSHLTPEERLRREEQRRKQKEAAERRARGEDIAPGHKRPLNSERRRANRRKPKWKKPSSEVKNDHHSSGYMHRKHGGQEYAEAQAY